MIRDELKPAPTSLIEQLQAARNHLLADLDEDRAADARHAAAGVSDPRSQRNDADEHLRQLCAALALGDLRPFAAYVQWLRSVQHHRRLPLEPIIGSLTRMRTWIEARLPHPATGSAAAVLSHGIELLREPDEYRPLVSAYRPTSLAEPARDYLQVLLDGRRDTAVDGVLAAMAAGAELVDLSVDLVQPALYEMGWLWEQNRIGVAQEHLATAITQNALAAGFAQSRFAPPLGRRAVFAGVAGNHHGLGLRMVSDAYEVAGWNVDFLGDDNPTPSLIRFVCDQEPDLLGLSVSLVHHVVTLREVIERLRAELGNATPAIIVGGLPFTSLGCSAFGIGADDCFEDARAAVAAAG